MAHLPNGTGHASGSTVSSPTKKLWAEIFNDLHEVDKVQKIGVDLALVGPIDQIESGQD
jgi:hypothetical protein